MYSLSTRKIPKANQFKYLKRYLKPKEHLILKISLLVLLINAVYLLTLVYKHYITLTPKVGGIYSEAIVSYPKLINPLYATNRDVDNDLSRLIYSSLFKYNNQGQLEADLVEKYEISDDFKEYKFILKDNLKWQDGQNLTSDDILFTLRLIQDEDYRSPLRLALSIIIKVEKIDERSFLFVLDEAYAPFLELLNFGILPKHCWEGIGSESAALTELNIKPIGSGPYKFKTLLKNKNGDLKEYNLERNDNYYAQLPYIKLLNFKFFSDQEEAIRAFNAGQVDGLNVLPFSLRQQLNFKDSILVKELTKNQLVGIFFNQNKNKELEVLENRQALALAINKEEIIVDVFANIYQVANSPITTTSFAYNNNLTILGHDFKLAQEKIERPFTLKLTVIDISSNMQVAQKIKEYWEHLGLEIELVIVNLEEAVDILKQRDFEALIYGLAIGGDPDVFSFWHSSQIGGSGLNIASYKNEEVDTLLIEARSAINQEERREKYIQFQEIINDELPIIFLYAPTYSYVQHKKIKGFAGEAIIEPADRFSDINNWYIKTKKTLFK